MNDLLIHPKTVIRINNIVSSSPQSILITGKDGSGKTTIARLLASKLIGVNIEDLNNYPYIKSLDSEESNIPIEEIRSLQQFLKLRVPAKDSQPINRIVIIERAERMRSEAQNALLKTLEEPPAGTAIILTVSSPDALLSTITSRTQTMEILPVSLAEAKNYYEPKGVSSALVNRYFALSQGQAGLLNALINNDDHPLISKVELAKTIMSEKTGDRLIRSDEIAKDKIEARRLLDAFLRITHATLSIQSSKDNMSEIKKWRDRQEMVIKSIVMLEKNAQAKLVFDNLFLSI